MREKENIADTFLRLADPLFRLALVRLGSRTDAEEIVQDIFLGVLKRDFRPNTDGYFFEATRNRCVDYLRRRARGKTEIGETSIVEPCLEEWPFLKECVERLTVEQRDVLILRFFCDLTLAETAQVQKCSINTVNSRQRYALEALRKSLNRSESANGGTV